MMKNNGGKIINLSTVATDNQPPKYLRDMYFRLAGVMNKDVAGNIIDMVSKKR